MVSVEELKAGISGLSDEELLKRWGARLFTEEALPIAEAELVRRNLDYSAEGISASNSRRESELSEARSILYVRALGSFIVAGACAGFALGLGLLGALIGGLFGWVISGPISRFLDKHLNATWSRFLFGAIIVVVVMVISMFASSIVGLALASRA